MAAALMWIWVRTSLVMSVWEVEWRAMAHRKNHRMRKNPVRSCAPCILQSQMTMCQMEWTGREPSLNDFSHIHNRRKASRCMKSLVACRAIIGWAHNFLTRFKTMGIREEGGLWRPQTQVNTKLKQRAPHCLFTWRGTSWGKSLP